MISLTSCNGPARSSVRAGRRTRRAEHPAFFLRQREPEMKYQTQKVAMLYFYGALTLFLAQVLFGLLAGTIYVLPNTLSVILPFNIVRMIHTNALIVWSLIGFMGATYYLLPEETETELYSPLLAKIQFWMFFG